MSSKLVKENPANKAMHYGQQANIGIINPPDKMPVVYVYSGQEGRMRYNQMQHDLYEGQKKAKPHSKKTPKIIKFIAFITAAAGLFIYRKKISNFIKNIFKRSEITAEH